MNLKELLEKIPISWKEHATSAFHTIVAAMLVELVMSGGAVPTTKEALVAIGAAVIRAGWKALWMWGIGLASKKV